MPSLLSAYYVLPLDQELGTQTVAQIFSLPQGSFLAPHLTSSTQVCAQSPPASEPSYQLLQPLPFLYFANICHHIHSVMSLSSGSFLLLIL